MTDRINGFVVVLEEAVREDDAEHIKIALEKIRGVVRVEPVVREISSDLLASRLRTQIARQLAELAETIARGDK